MKKKLYLLILLTYLCATPASYLFSMQRLTQNLQELRINLSALNSKLWLLDKKLNGLNLNLVKSQPPVLLQDIFNFVTGFDEIKDKNFHIKFNTHADGFTYIQNAQTGEDFCCGKITKYSLEELQNWDKKQGTQEDANGSFTFIFYSGEHPQNFFKTDVCNLQADPENRDAVFQLASRFHALEGGCAHNGILNVTAPYGFNAMLMGAAQGEYASFSAAPGTIYKIYGYAPINLLEDTPFGHLINPKASGGSMPHLANVVETVPDENWTKSLKIYLQEHIQVVAGGKDAKGGRQRVPNSQFINQIPVAAFDWRLGNADKERLREITREMLNGFYEGTLLAAAKHNKSKIYLTAVGGGVFKNDHDLIMKAVANEQTCRIINKYKLQVFLVMHQRAGYKDFGPWDIFLKKTFEDKNVKYKSEQV